MHGRAVQREEQWKQKALAGEQIIKQLLVLLGWCVQRIEEFKRQLTWLNKQQFGSKSEATRATAGVAEEGQPPARAGQPEPGPDQESPRAAAGRQRSQTATAPELTSTNDPAHDPGPGADLSDLRQDPTGNWPHRGE